MKVRDLIVLLSSIDDMDREVILQKDCSGCGECESEGVRYAPLAGAFDASFKPISIDEVIVGLEELTEEAIKDGCTQDDILVGGKPAIVFFTN
jgi:hypothetical protein